MSIAGRARAAAAAILALLIAALWMGPVSAYLHLVATGADELAERAMLLQRYRALVDTPVANAKAAAAVMLPPAPEAQAVAQLQEAVKSAAAAGKMRIDSLQVLRSETFAGALKIGVRVHAAGDAGGVGRLLFAIEAARPALFPDNLQIQARAAVVGTPPGMLDVQLDVSAFTPGASS